MLCVLAEVRMEKSLLETGVQLMIFLTTSFRTMNATPSGCFQTFSTVQDLVPLIRSISPRPVHLTSARPKMSHRWHFNSMSELLYFFPLACREWTFRVAIIAPFFWHCDGYFRPNSTLIGPTLVSYRGMHGRC